MRKKISIIIPVYNESGNLLLMIESIRKVFSGLDYNFNITFINDGSTDETLTIIKKIANKIKFPNN